MDNYIYTDEELKNEVWVGIENYIGLYEISSLGRVKALEKYYYSGRNNSILKHQKEIILKQDLSNNGYYRVSLHKDGVIERVSVHRLVAKAFVDNPNNFTVVNHIDSNKINNREINLEWCTHSHNTIHAYASGRMKNALDALTGEKSKSCKISDAICFEIIARYKNGGISQKKLGDEFGISDSAVSMIINGKRRSYLTTVS